MDQNKTCKELELPLLKSIVLLLYLYCGEAIILFLSWEQRFLALAAALLKSCCLFWALYNYCTPYFTQRNITRESNLHVAEMKIHLVCSCCIVLVSNESNNYFFLQESKPSQYFQFFLSNLRRSQINSPAFFSYKPLLHRLRSCTTIVRLWYKNPFTQGLTTLRSQV